MKKQKKSHWNSMLTVKLNLENNTWEVDIVGRTRPPYVSTEYDGQERLLMSDSYRKTVLPVCLIDRLEQRFNQAYKNKSNLPI